MGRRQTKTDLIAIVRAALTAADYLGEVQTAVCLDGALVALTGVGQLPPSWDDQWGLDLPDRAP